MAKDNLKKNSKCLVIGGGGHGIICIFNHIFNNPEIDFDIILLTCDDGGCTGRIKNYFNKALLEIPEKFLGNLNPSKPSIALGDLKNNILAWAPVILKNELMQKGHNLTQSQLCISNVQKCFEFRSDNIYLHNQCFQELCIYFPLLLDYRQSFLNVSTYYLNEMKEEKIKTSFGNLLLQIIYNESQNSHEFFKKLKSIGFIPQNVNLHFLVEKQLVLEAQFYNENKLKSRLISEAKIDASDKPFILDSYILKDDMGIIVDLNYLDKYNPRLLGLINSYHLNNSNSYFLLPAGSISNLIPVINILYPVLHNKNLPIIHISNAFEQANEQKLQYQIEYIHKLFHGQPLIVFGVSRNPFDFVNLNKKSDWEEKYKKEAKQATSQIEVSKYIASQNINSTSIYLPILSMEEAEGLKYPTNLIDDLIKKTILNWRYSETILDFHIKMKRFIPPVYRQFVDPDLPQKKEHSVFDREQLIQYRI